MMLAYRLSPAGPKKYNKNLRKKPRAKATESNRAWLRRATGSEDITGRILLLGGADLTHFRIRIAQSHARRDLLPSFWSHVAIIGAAAGRGRRGAADRTLYEVALEPSHGFGNVPKKNGLQKGSLAVYDDPDRFPNIACLRFPTAPESKKIVDAIEDFTRRRTLLDIPSLLVQWLGFVWGVGDQGNPLLAGVGLPSAAFVEAVFAQANVDLTPGLASKAGCPEAIWQASKWWNAAYQKGGLGAGEPSGLYCLSQREAAVRDMD